MSKPRDPFHVYIARPLSGRTPEEHARFSRDADVVAGILEGCGCTHYDPIQDPRATGQSYLPDGAGYRYSREQLARADLGIFLLSAASWGVGAQNEVATSLVIPVVFLHPSEAPLASPMLSSSFSLHWLLTYADEEDLRIRLPELLRNVEKHVVWSRDVRRQAAARRDPAEFGQRLAALRLRKGLSQEALAKVAGAPTVLMNALEQLPDTVLSPSLELLYRLAVILDISPAELIDWH